MILRITFIWTILMGVIGCTSTTMVTNRDGEATKVKCQPIYGNWCGKGYPAYKVTGYKPRPVDVWDAACMEHDLCYDKYREEGKEVCDDIFSERIEYIDLEGVPAPHQIINAYNYFKSNKPYRHIYISFKDIWDANTVSCEGGEGIPTLFCDVGLGRDNCEISMGLQEKDLPCFCDFPRGTRYAPPGRYWGVQKTANDF